MKRLFIILLFQSLLLPLVAQNLSADQISKRVGDAADKMKTMQCSFVQTKTVKLLNDKMVSHGKMYYKNDNQLRWEYTTPYTYCFVLNGSKVMLANGKQRNVIDVQQNKMFKGIARIMMNSVTGASLSNNKDFDYSIADKGKEWVATLTPLRRDLKQMFSKIVLHIDPSTALVRQVEMTERGGDNTVIELKDIKTNESIAADIFAVE